MYNFRDRWVPIRYAFGVVADMVLIFVSNALEEGS